MSGFIPHYLSPFEISQLVPLIEAAITEFPERRPSGKPSKKIKMKKWEIRLRNLVDAHGQIRAYSAMPVEQLETLVFMVVDHIEARKRYVAAEKRRAATKGKNPQQVPAVQAGT